MPELFLPVLGGLGRLFDHFDGCLDFADLGPVGGTYYLRKSAFLSAKCRDLLGVDLDAVEERAAQGFVAVANRVFVFLGGGDAQEVVFLLGKSFSFSGQD